MNRIKVRTPPLHAGQATVRESPARFKVLRAGRRFGKTVLAAIMCIEVALGVAPWHHRCHDGTAGRAWWVAPTYKVARIGWRLLRTFAMSIKQVWPGIIILEGEKEIVFPNGGIIALRSADSSSGLRGEGLDFLIMEEAAYIPETAWSEDLRPALSDRQGHALFISTPDGYNWFYELEQAAAKRDGWETFHYPTSANPHIPPAELEVARAEVPAIVYAQEYEAEFIDDETRPFHRGMFRYYERTDKGQVRAGDEAFDLDGLHRFGMVDLAASVKTSADYTVVGAFAVSPAGKLIVLDVVRDRLPGPAQIDLIQAMAEKWDLGYVGIESVAYQSTAIDHARKRGLPVRKVTPDKDKLTRSIPLQVMMEGSQVFFPADAAWTDVVEAELTMFPQGEHDDIVDVLAYAAAGMNRRRRHYAY